MPASRFRVGIIGAGIIGVSTACFLAERNVAVTLMDPSNPGEGGASRANAGQIFPSLVFPLASPATLRNSIRLLTDKMSPLSIPAKYSLQVAPWLLEFARASTEWRFRNGVAALTGLNKDAIPCFEALLLRAGLSKNLRAAGAIQVYDSKQALEDGVRLWKSVPETHTGHLALLDRQRLQRLEPALGASFEGGILLPNTAVLSDPLDAVRGLSRYAQSLGAVFKRGFVRNVAGAVDSADVRLAHGETCSFDRIVIAAGVWSNTLLKGLSEPQPLESERGYNLTVPAARSVIRHALVFAERGVVATQLASGLRLGGWSELGGTELPPRGEIFERISICAREILPGLDWRGAERWMGQRPALPDGLPVIGRSRKHPSVYYAFGHGHLGMTQGPVTGKAIATLITGGHPEINLSPFAPRK